MQYLAVVLDSQTLLVTVLGYTRPHYIPLAHVPYSFGAVDQMMDLTLQDRFEVGLHLTTRDLDPYAEREDSAFRHIVHVGSQDLDLAVVYGIEIDACHKLECYGLVSAELDPRVLFPYTLALERGAVRHRDRDLRYLDLAASDLKRFFDHLVVGYAGHDMLVGTYARGQYLRYVRIGYDREAVVERSRGSRVFLLVHLAERENEREHPVLVVLEVGFVVAGLDAAE